VTGATTTAITPLRIGVIGVGRIGRMHTELLAHKVRGAAVRTVYDSYEQPLREVAADLGVPPAASVEELLDGDVDAVAVCSSTDSHAELVIAAVRAGKAVFCEKPVSLDLHELDRVLAAVDSAGAPFQIGFNRRFDPAHAAVRDLLSYHPGLNEQAMVHLAVGYARQRNLLATFACTSSIGPGPRTW
jgi:myo-inositol 2-dehydrogenase / D-chiro-inositol 1-dehydrogenase